MFKFLKRLFGLTAIPKEEFVFTRAHEPEVTEAKPIGPCQTRVDVNRRVSVPIVKKSQKKPAARKATPKAPKPAVDYPVRKPAAARITPSEPPERDIRHDDNPDDVGTLLAGAAAAAILDCALSSDSGSSDGGSDYSGGGGDFGGGGSSGDY